MQVQAREQRTASHSQNPTRSPQLAVMNVRLSFDLPLKQRVGRKISGAAIRDWEGLLRKGFGPMLGPEAGTINGSLDSGPLS